MTHTREVPRPHDGALFPPKQAADYPTAALVPNLVQAQVFLDYLTDGDPATFQTFDDQKGRSDRKLARVFHGTLDEHASSLAPLNQQRAGVYVMVNVGDLKGRRAKNVIRVRVVVLDLDGAPLEPVLLGPLPPHIIVMSSEGRYQVYWLVDGLSLKEFSPIQSSLAAFFGGDSSVTDLPRVMRLPGFFHCKAGPVMVQVLDADPCPPYSRLDLLRAFPVMAQAIATSKRKTKRSGLSLPMGWQPPADTTRHILEAAEEKAKGVWLEGQGRHDTLLWVACEARRRHLNETAALDLVMRVIDLLPPRDYGPVSDSEALTMVQWAYANITPDAPLGLGQGHGFRASSTALKGFPSLSAKPHLGQSGRPSLGGKPRLGGK